jgi:hypothetical protein
MEPDPPWASISRVEGLALLEHISTSLEGMAARELIPASVDDLSHLKWVPESHEDHPRITVPFLSHTAGALSPLSNHGRQGQLWLRNHMAMGVRCCGQHSLGSCRRPSAGLCLCEKLDAPSGVRGVSHDGSHMAVRRRQTRRWRRARALAGAGVRGQRIANDAATGGRQCAGKRPTSAAVSAPTRLWPSPPVRWAPGVGGGVVEQLKSLDMTLATSTPPAH